MIQIVYILITLAFVLTSCGQSKIQTSQGRMWTENQAIVKNVKIYMALEPTPADTPHAWLSLEGDEIQRLSLCHGSKETCQVNRTEHYTFTERKKGQISDLRYFRSDARLNLHELKTVTILGFNKDNELKALKSVAFRKTHETNLVLSDAQNLKLIASNGSEIKLSQLFTKEYMVLDLSSSSCSSCVELAKEHDQRQEFTSIFNNGKCEFASIVPEDDLNTWQANFGANSFFRQHSYETSIGHNNVAKNFGINLTTIPMIFIIDRSGSVIEAVKNGMPTKLLSTCGSGTGATSMPPQTNPGITEIEDIAQDSQIDPLTGIEQDDTSLIGDMLQELIQPGMGMTQPSMTQPGLMPGGMIPGCSIGGG